MSADNYSACPRCVKELEAAATLALMMADDAYGKVDRQTYAYLEVQADKAQKASEEPPDTLEEYYEIGIDDAGKFYVHYSAECRNCTFKHEFKHESPVPGISAAPSGEPGQPYFQGRDR